MKRGSMVSDFIIAAAYVGDLEQRRQKRVRHGSISKGTICVFLLIISLILRCTVLWERVSYVQEFVLPNCSTSDQLPGWKEDLMTRARRRVYRCKQFSLE
jgi:hypothetical protein